MNKTLEELQADLVEARAELEMAEAVLDSRLYVDNPYGHWAARLHVDFKKTTVRHIKSKVEALKEKANEN